MLLKYIYCPLQGSSQFEEMTVEVDQGIVFPLLTSGAGDADVGEVSVMSCYIILHHMVMFHAEQI